VLLAAPLLAAQPAAAVPGLVTSQRTSAVDSTAQKVVFAPCPVGTHAVGGSAVVGGSTRIQVNTEVPDASGYTVLARELRGGTTADWHVVVTAQCAPAASLPGLEYVRTASAFDSARTHGATAACSPGKRLVGVGGLLDSRGPGQDRLVLTAVRPQPALTSVRVTGAEAEAGYAGPWSATAVAVCTTPRAGHSLATATSAVSSAGFKHAVAACPTGTKVHAGGFDVGSGRGQVRLSTSFLDPDLTADPTRQGFAAQAREDATGTAARWRVASFAICAA
jgi:hypothetical protein